MNFTHIRQNRSVPLTRPWFRAGVFRTGTTIAYLNISCSQKLQSLCTTYSHRCTLTLRILSCFRLLRFNLLHRRYFIVWGRRLEFQHLNTWMWSHLHKNKIISLSLYQIQKVVKVSFLRMSMSFILRFVRHVLINSIVLLVPMRVDSYRSFGCVTTVTYLLWSCSRRQIFQRRKYFFVFLVWFRAYFFKIKLHLFYMRPISFLEATSSSWLKQLQEVKLRFSWTFWRSKLRMDFHSLPNRLTCCFVALLCRVVAEQCFRFTRFLNLRKFPTNVKCNFRHDDVRFISNVLMTQSSATFSLMAKLFMRWNKYCALQIKLSKFHLCWELLNMLL